jgi:hypothetical protein
MATITYLDVDKTADSVVIKGVKFTANKAVETNDKELLEKFKDHPHFKVSGEYDPSKPSETKPPPEEPADQAQAKPAPTSTQTRK